MILFPVFDTLRQYFKCMEMKWTDESDRRLVREFVHEHSEPAFTALAERHMQLVYGAAMRATSNHSAAEEITQNVFLELARKSKWLQDRESVAAWLHRAALLEARQWRRSEGRRKIREQTAIKWETTMKTTEDDLPKDAAMVDEALLQLREKDRQAVLLRFFEGRNNREIGKALGIGEDAARKRIDKALMVMETYFRKRGHAAGASAILSMAAGAHTASTGLAASVVQAALSVHSAQGIGGMLGTWLGGWLGMNRMQYLGMGLAVLLMPALWQQGRLISAEEERKRLASLLGSLHARQEELEQNRFGVQLQIQQLSNSLVLARQAREISRNRQTNLVAGLDPRLFRWNATSRTVRLPKDVLKRISFDGKNSDWGIGSYPAEVEKVIDKTGRLSPALLEVLGLSGEEQNRLQRFVISSVELYRQFANAQARMGGLEMLASPPPDFLVTNSDTRVWMIPALSENVANWKEQFLSGIDSIIGRERSKILLHQASQDGSLSRVLENFGETTPVILITPLPDGDCLLTRSIPHYGRPSWFGNNRVPISSILDRESNSNQRMAEDFLRRPLPAALVDYLRAWRQLHPEKAGASKKL